MNRSASVCRTRDKGINSRDKGIKDSNNSKRTVSRNKGNSQVNNKHGTDNKDSRGNKVNNLDNSQDSKISAVNKDNNLVKVKDNSKPAIINKDSKGRDNRVKGSNKVKVSKGNKDKVRGKGREINPVVRVQVAGNVRMDNTMECHRECPEAVGCHPAENARLAQNSANGCVKRRTCANN